MPSDSVEPHLHVLYGVWVPTKGWAGPYRYNKPQFTKRPKFWQVSGMAKRAAVQTGGQLIVFDVTPTLRSWPSLETDAAK